MKRAILLFIGLIGVTSTTVAQNVTSQGIQVLARPDEQVIRLRWAPTSAVDWELLNRYGYYIDRFTLIRDGELLPEPTQLRLANEPIRPQPLANWEGLADANDYAAVAAQAIYGETFELTEDYSSDIVQVIQKSRELEQRFSFALFAADQSFEVAMMSGLGFIDHTARADEKYLYRVYAALPEQLEPIDTGSVLVGRVDYKPLPAVYDVQALFGDRAVMVSWERQNFDGVYNSFLLEKSSDGGKTYQSVTDQPLINTTEGQQYQSRRAYKLDSLAENDVTYYYRVRGITAFGEVSPPSDSVFGQGFLELSIPPQLTQWDTDDNTVDLAWEFPSANELPIAGFLVERSPSNSGPFVTIATLDDSQRSWQDPQPLATNYYRVTAYRESTQRSSFPVLVQLSDSIPPMTPMGITGTIDSAGLVSLRWAANEEPDFLGYRVFRSNFQSAEFVQMTEEPLTDNSWVDTINLNSLTENIYYALVAVDQRYNESILSESLTLTRPDIVPPAAPVLTTLDAAETGVHLHYIASASEDVASYIIYRRGKNDAGWVPLKEQSAEEAGEYLDESVTPNIPYAYTVVAVDDSGLESEPSRPKKGVFVRTMAEIQPENLQVAIDREALTIRLTWKYDGAAQEFKVLRGPSEDQLFLYRTVTGGQRLFLDENLTLDTQYVYGIQAIDPAGLPSNIILTKVAF
ncbi:MAG: hypothetical protein AAFQ98_00580 [Bacteroidota bacterium]